MNTRREFLSAAVTAVVFPSLLRGAPAAKFVTYSNPRTYEIEHTSTITNHDVDLTEVELWLPVPLEWPEQKVAGAAVSPKAPLRKPQVGQAQVARLLLTKGLPAPGQSLTFTARYRVTRSAIETDKAALAKEPYQPYPKNEDYRKFTRAERLIETGDAALQEAARQFQTDDQPAYQLALRIYEWILDRTTYELVEGIRGAKFCLQEQRGECGDYCTLFVALCRLAKIPARVCLGCWASQTNGWHVWAEFQLPNGEWIPVDPALGDQAAAKRENSFGALGNDRVTLVKGCDLEFRGAGPGHSRVDFLHAGVWWYKTSRSAQEPTWEPKIVGQMVEGK